MAFPHEHPSRVSAWQRVTKSCRCPVCGRPDWCLIAADGTAAICARVQSGKRCGEAGWLHRLGTPLVGQITRPVPAARKLGVPRAADTDLDGVYRALLARLQLANRHRAHLLGRGLTDVDLDRAGYRSLPAGCRAAVVKALREHFADDLLLTVPGVIVREGQHGRYLTLAGLPGILVPVRSVAGHVVALVMRPDDPGDGGKYRWLSSASDNGASPGWRVHVPANVGPGAQIVLTEGTLKADVAAAVSGWPIVGLPGPYVTAEALATLTALGAEQALLALDADTSANRHVARAQLDGLRQLKAAGFVAGLVRWDRTLGNGLDDALRTLTGRKES